MNMDTYSYKHMHDKNPYTKKWIVIRTEMCITKTQKNIDNYFYRDVYDKNPYKNNMDSHLYKDVHDENP